jgi:hypothetical protein
MLLFPRDTKYSIETKLGQVRTVWGWSKSPLPKSDFLSDNCLKGVGNPGTAYLTRRYEQFGFFLEVFTELKKLPPLDRGKLVASGTPWPFVEWLDGLEHADRRPIRNAILFFLFPDDLERNVSNDHRRQIVDALKSRIPEDKRPTTTKPSLLECDKAIAEIRKSFARELGTTELDFYRDPIKPLWWTGVRDKARSAIGSSLAQLLSSYGLEIHQCGAKKAKLQDCYPTDPSTGYWADPADATGKPLRWLLHIDVEARTIRARLPGLHGDSRVAFANTTKGVSGAVACRVIPVLKLKTGQYLFHETWEWMLLFCFLPALEPGSSGQAFDDFNVSTGVLRYRGKVQPYVYAVLVTLNEDEDTLAHPDLLRPVRYSELTKAIAALINIDAR